MHTVIIGNGIIGLTTAFRLLQRGGDTDRVSIVGQKNREGSASLAAGAMLNSFAEIEAGSLESDLDLYRFELSHLATRMWPKFENELISAAGSNLPNGCKSCQGCIGGGCFEAGTYVINNTAADHLDDENFDAILDALISFNEPHRLISPEEIPNYSPEQRYRATRALLIENEGWFNPRLIIEKLDHILDNDPRINILNEEVISITQTNEIISHVTLSSNEVIEADNFVIATGASTSKLIKNSNLKINIQPIFYGVGVSIEIESPEHPHTKCIRTPNRGLACGIYTVPYFTDPISKNDHILIGATNYISPTPIYNPRVSSVESLLKAAMEQVNTNFYRGGIVRTNIGWRPVSQDSYPLLGRTSIQNLIIATGTKRDGFHMSPLISDYICNLIQNKDVDKRLEVFSPERKIINNLSRSDAIKIGVKQLLSASYQHGFTPSKNRMSEQVAQMYQDQLERLHDEVGAIDWGIPPEMLDMYKYGHAINPTK